MPEKPADVAHVEVPWHQNPGKALNDWQQEKSRKFDEDLKKNAEAAPASPAEPHTEHKHHVYGAEWPGAVAEWLWNQEDSNLAHVAKFPLILLSPVVIGPLALVGHLVDEVRDLKGVMEAAFPLEPLFRPIPTAEEIRNSTEMQVPNIPFPAHDEATGGPTGTSVAHEEMPQVHVAPHPPVKGTL